MLVRPLSVTSIKSPNVGRRWTCASVEFGFPPKPPEITPAVQRTVRAVEPTPRLHRSTGELPVAERVVGRNVARDGRELERAWIRDYEYFAARGFASGDASADGRMTRCNGREVALSVHRRDS